MNEIPTVDIGFMVVTGHPAGLRAGPAERAVTLRLFELPMAG